MSIITIENNGKPWVICQPSDPGDLERFLDASAASAVGSGFAKRQATAAEISKFTADLCIHRFRGGEPHNFFATSA